MSPTKLYPMNLDSPLYNGPASLEDPLYYLHNFKWVLNWVNERYGDLLSDAERHFVSKFHELPQASQGLAVRMVMRKGHFFRADKLRYDELGAAELAAQPLLAADWLGDGPLLDLESLFKLFTWGELHPALAELLAQTGVASARKGEALEALQEFGLEPRSPAAWGLSQARVYELKLMPLCDRFRLMFFGNLHQDWSEFVLTELGTYRYEQVEFSLSSRPFQAREEVDDYLQLNACAEQLNDGAPLEEVTAALPALVSDNAWLSAKRGRLLFKLGREWERAGGLTEAAALYRQSDHREARCRDLRVLELQGSYAEALEIALQAQQAPTTDAEQQLLQSMIPRLHKKLGLSATKVAASQPDRMDLVLPAAPSVELAVQQYLEASEAPVYYVENTLLTGLFGLLCWDAIFAALPGAFFHPFQRGPADLHWPNFHRRRWQLFERCFQALEEGDHRTRIMAAYEAKWGLQSPFVHWGVLTPEVLDHALRCIPAHHLKAIFERILLDLKANRAGLPDLIQFWPQERRYRMIEVKGPGDRLQDNQRRWLDFFAHHEMPVTVCYVTWQTPQADDV
jgi:hypothetical protein